MSKLKHSTVQPLALWSAGFKPVRLEGFLLLFEVFEVGVACDLSFSLTFLQRSRPLCV